jgi:hypothetical protein
VDYPNVASFAVSKSAECRFIRLTQTGWMPQPAFKKFTMDELADEFATIVVCISDVSLGEQADLECFLYSRTARNLILRFP